MPWRRFYILLLLLMMTLPPSIEGAPPLFNPLPLEEGIYFKEDVLEEREGVIGLFDGKEAFMSHPSYQRLVKLEEELHYFYGQLEKEKRGLSLLQEAVERRREDLEKKREAHLEGIREEYREKIDEQEKALERSLEEYSREALEELTRELQIEREALEREAKEQVSSRVREEEEEYQLYVEELLEEYKPQILNLRIKLLVLSLSPLRRETLEEEKEYLERELERRVQIHREDLQKRLEEFRFFFDRQVVAQIQAYERRGLQKIEEALHQREREKREDLEIMVQKIEEELTILLLKETRHFLEEKRESLREMEALLIEEMEKRILYLKSEIERLEKALETLSYQIYEELIEVVSILAREKGLDLVLEREDESLEGYDMTLRVIDYLQ